MKILVVEDSSAMRRVIKNTIVKFLKTDFIEASNGGEAMDILKIEDDIDLVITDWLMPAVDGIQLTQFIKADDRLKDIPVLMITTNSTRYDIIEAIKAGVSDYIVKPINPNLLETKVKNIITKLKENFSQEKIGDIIQVANEETTEETEVVQDKEEVEVTSENDNTEPESNNTEDIESKEISE